ncbi:MAG: hypothetical protein H6818_20935 [Phycisphaerales bacterium]|nr:hypothetical protein [Phycisphaerales bacterium]MCB9862257.1 hypothetical protein [Phycisphaerales bacterium]
MTTAAAASRTLSRPTERTIDSARTIAVVAKNDAFLDHVLKWLGSLLGVSFQRTHEVHAPSGAVIDYARCRRIPGALWIPENRYSTSAPPPLDVADLVGIRRNELRIDVFDAIRFWTSDEAHADAPDEALDRHERLKYDGSLFARHGMPAIPIVNHYVNVLRTAIETEFGIRTKPIWPTGKKACVILTHDVDAPLDPNTPATKRHLSRLHGVSRLSRLRSSLRDAIHTGRITTTDTADRHWLFDEIMAAESRHGFRSTFFFAPRHFGMPRADRAHDVRYDIADKQFRRLFPTLVDRGFEIALHASYNAQQDHSMFAEEIRRLKRFAAAPIRGVRHHYWRLGRSVWPTLNAHADAGLEYDASLAFNESPGFRFGVALPFYPWDSLAQCPVGACQIPSMLMDGAVFYRPGATAADGIRTANEWIDKLVDAGGCGAIDWHVRTSYPGSRQFAEWGRAYLGILEALAARDDVFVTNCAGLVDHLRNRDRTDCPSCTRP